MGKYAYSDMVEDIVGEELEDKGFFPSINRTKKNGKNSSQTIFLNGKTYLLPDISIFESQNRINIIVRVEVKSFYQYVKRGSPNTKENLIPIKKRQLRSYYKLQQEEEIECKIVVVVGDANKSRRKLKFFNAALLELAKMDRYDSPYDKEDAFWFDISDFNSGII